MKNYEFKTFLRVVRQLSLVFLLFGQLNCISDEFSEFDSKIIPQNELNLSSVFENLLEKIDDKSIDNQLTNNISKKESLKITTNQISSKNRRLNGKLKQTVKTVIDKNNKTKQDNYYNTNKDTIDLKSLKKEAQVIEKQSEEAPEKKQNQEKVPEIEKSDCGCADGSSSANWFSNLHYRMNGFRTLYDYSEMHIEAWIEYMNDFFEGKIENSALKGKDISFFRKIGQNHEIESVDHEFVYGVWLTKKDTKNGHSEINFYPETLGAKYLLRIYNMKYRTIDRSREYFNLQFQRWIKWKNEMISKSESTNNDPNMEKNNSEETEESNMSIFQKEKDPTIFDDPSDYLPLSLFPIRTQSKEKKCFYSGAEKKGLAQQLKDLILFIFKDPNLGPDPRWLDEFSQDGSKFDAKSDSLVASDVDKLLAVVEKLADGDLKNIDALKNENLGEFVLQDKTRLFKKQNDVMFYNLPDDNAVYKKYYFNVLAATTLTQLLEGLEAIVGIQQFARFLPTKVPDFSITFNKNINEMLFESGNRPLVTEINIKLKNTSTGNTEVYSYWFIMSFQLTVLNKQRTGQGFKIFMHWIRRGNKKNKFHDVSSEALESAGSSNSGVKNCIVTTNFEKLTAKEKGACDYVTNTSWDRAITYPDMFSRTLCRATKTGLHQLFKKLASEISSASPAWNYDAICPYGSYLGNMKVKSSGYDFTCTEFNAYLQNFIKSLNDKSQFEYFDNPNFFDEKGAKLNHESLKKVLSFVNFKCKNDPLIYQPLEDGSSSGYINFDERIIGFFEFKRKYKTQVIMNDSEEKKIEFSKTFANGMINFINTRDGQKGGFKKFKKITFQGGSSGNEEEGPETPSGDWNNMCYKVDFTFTQNTYSFLECIKYIPFDPEDNADELMTWKYHRLFLHYFKLGYTVFHSVNFQFTPYFIARQITSIKEDFEIELTKSLEESPPDDPLKSVLLHFSFKKYQHVILRLEVYLSNIYYLRFFIKTSHQEFEIFIERYPVHDFAYLLTKSENTLYVTQNNIDKTILDDIPNSPIAKLEEIRKNTFDKKYLKKITNFISTLLNIEDSTMLEELDSLENEKMIETANNKCIVHYSKTDLVSFPLLAEMLEQILLTVDLKKISFLNSDENDSKLDEGSLNNESKISIIANTFEHHGLEDMLFNNFPSFFANDQHEEGMNKFASLQKFDIANCKTRDSLFEKYKEDFLTNYWILLKLEIDPVKIAYVFVTVHAFESDALYFFYFSFKCEHFQQDFVIPYIQINIMHGILQNIILNKLSHLWKTVVLTFREMNDSSEQQNKIPDLNDFSKEVWSLFDKLLMEAESQKVELCESNSKQNPIEFPISYCLKDKSSYSADPIVKVREPKIVATLSKIDIPNEKGVNIQIHYRNMKALFAKTAKKYENVPNSSSYKIPVQYLTKENLILRTHLKEIISMIKRNLSKA